MRFLPASFETRRFWLSAVPGVPGQPRRSQRAAAEGPVQGQTQGPRCPRPRAWGGGRRWGPRGPRLEAPLRMLALRWPLGGGVSSCHETPIPLWLRRACAPVRPSGSRSAAFLRLGDPAGRSRPYFGLQQVPLCLWPLRGVIVSCWTHNGRGRESGPGGQGTGTLPPSGGSGGRWHCGEAGPPRPRRAPGLELAGLPESRPRALQLCVQPFRQETVGHEAQHF